MSTIKAEYVGCAQVAMEAIWIRQFLLDFRLVSIAHTNIPLGIDNMTGLYLAKGHQLHQRAKHIKQK